MASVANTINDGLTEEDFRFAERVADMEVDRVFSGDSFLRTVIKRFVSKKSNMFGLILLGVLILLSINQL